MGMFQEWMGMIGWENAWLTKWREGVRPRCKPKKTWTEVVEKDLNQ